MTRTFVLQRIVDDSGVSGTGTVAWGVEFPDGVAVLRWNTEFASTAIYKNLEELERIHGHDGHSILLFNYGNDCRGNEDCYDCWKVKQAGRL